MLLPAIVTWTAFFLAWAFVPAFFIEYQPELLFVAICAIVLFILTVASYVMSWLQGPRAIKVIIMLVAILLMTVGVMFMWSASLYSYTAEPATCEHTDFDATTNVDTLMITSENFPNYAFQVHELRTRSPPSLGKKQDCWVVPCTLQPHYHVHWRDSTYYLEYKSPYCAFIRDLDVFGLTPRFYYHYYVPHIVFFIGFLFQLHAWFVFHSDQHKTKKE